MMNQGSEPGKVKVAVGLSGGVDSSVAAALLQQRGYAVIGITMEIFDGSIAVEETARHACYGPGEEEDVAAAAAVCKNLAIPYSVIDLRQEYREHVIDYFKNEYLAGRTPNPCIVCNRLLKFGFMLEKAKAAGIDFEYFATGHYARIEKSEGRFFLKKATDHTKDQTYFLYGLTPQQLAHTIFPLGTYTKNRVREIARSLGLETADRPESQDFIAGRDYTPLFAEDEIRPGDIVDENGCLLGKHRGIIHYTVGQRRGLGIASDRPLYVMDIDADKNRLIVGVKKNLFSKGLIASNLNFLAVESLDQSYEVKARIRLRHTAAEATIYPDFKNTVKVLFKESQTAVTPGQSVVFYRGDTVFGGGIIEKAL
jgi:tRNA-specific 2-thiouridylase